MANIIDWGSALMSLDQVKRQPVEWLWKKFIPYKQTTIIQGDPSIGKSWLCMQVMVDLAREGKHSLYVCNEDLPEYVTLPRIQDTFHLEDEYLPNIHVFRANEKHQLHLPYSSFLSDSLCQLIRKTEAKICIFNPIQSYLPHHKGLQKAEDTRPIFDELSRVGVQEGCTFCLIRHNIKGNNGRSANDKGYGSIDISGAARTIISMTLHPDFELVPGEDFCKVTAVGQTKNNIGIEQPSLTFELRPNQFTWLPEARQLSIEEFGDKAVDPVNQVDPSEVKDCRDILRAYFKKVKRRRADLCIELCKNSGYSASTARRAATQLGIDKSETEHDANGKFIRGWWRMP